MTIGATERADDRAALRETARPAAGLGRKVAGQGAMLFSGFAIAQASSFARNAVLGHCLSRGDFGIAATITLALQLLETLSDLGSDRLIVQAADGDDRRVVGAAHVTLVLRGVVTALLLYLSAGPFAALFGIGHAQAAFELAALVPLLKGFTHLDSRRLQRDLDNRPYMVIETAPQVVALGLALPLMQIAPSYVAVVWLALMQAAMAVVISHLLARRRYELHFGGTYIARVFQFGWPIWLSAFPLVAVFHADRMIVGSALGMDALAGYTAAFMVTMVPGLIAAKIGHALMLPLLSQVNGDAVRFMRRAQLLTEGTAIIAAAYVMVFVVAGGALLPLAFGPNFGDLGLIAALLAVMWCVRMVQALPGMALMADGRTVPLFHAGMIRAASIVLALAAIPLGFGAAGVAAAGIAGELASLTYVSLVAGRVRPGFAAMFLLRMMFVAGAVMLAIVVGHACAGQESVRVVFPAAVVGAVAVAFFGLAVMPSIRGLVSRLRWPKAATANA